jgi:hypothetical protein
MEERAGNGLVTETIPFRAGDGFACNLLHVRGPTPPTRRPVLLVHGAGVRANIFRAPVETTFVDYLVARGHDVWLENWRGSIDFPRNEWTLDQSALYDHPVAVKTVVERTGVKEISAVIHCQGSTAFTMSAVAGLIPQVTKIVTNAVSLHPIISTAARLKLKIAVPIVGALTPFMDAQWTKHSPGIVPKILTATVRATHHECDNLVCRYSSFIYGVGHPVLWRHENLNPATHEWLKQEFAACPISFFRQMSRCVSAGRLVRYEKLPGLPEDFAARAPQTDARFAFFAGEKNNCFRAKSQVASYEFFNAHRPGVHSLNVVKDYGHLDMFMGQNAARDVFPLMAAALE